MSLTHIKTLAKALVSPQPINENALRWVLNMRHAMKRVHHQRYACNEEYKTALNKLLDADGHSGATFAWTYAQTLNVEKHGLDAWLASPASK